MVIKHFINRLLRRIHWFYKNVIKETDEFMVFYYTIFAFSMFIVFYLWGLVILIERKIGIDFLEYDKMKYFLFALGIVGMIMFYFWRKKKDWEKFFKESRLQFNKYDIAVLLYVVLSFFTFFYNLLQSWKWSPAARSIAAAIYARIGMLGYPQAVQC